MRFVCHLSSESIEKQSWCRSLLLLVLLGLELGGLLNNLDFSIQETSDNSTHAISKRHMERINLYTYLVLLFPTMYRHKAWLLFFNVFSVYGTHGASSQRFPGVAAW